MHLIDTIYIDNYGLQIEIFQPKKLIRFATTLVYICNYQHSLIWIHICNEHD